MGRSILLIVIGMVLMYIVLKILSSKTVQPAGASTAAFKKLASTGYAYNLIRTNEFRELVKTPEFRELVRTLAAEQVTALTSALV